MLGVAVSVLIRLKTVAESPFERLPRESKSGIIGVYTSVVLMSKVSIPEHVLVGRLPALFVYSLFFYFLFRRRLSTTLFRRMSLSMIWRKTSFR